ncbi:unnamed protein product [Schistosoma curassoni]|uniref:Kazal-like domain-containing protein n=1 Tax=Schistosoma curassoni TaxID=6186 RepID=A0A183JJY5_9TREM|nr:unnamed protein product [Schistosoma curassoni]
MTMMNQYEYFPCVTVSQYCCYYYELDELNYYLTNCHMKCPNVEAVQ